MKSRLLLLLVAVIVLFASTSRAENPHHEHEPQDSVVATTNEYSIVNNYASSTVVLAIAMGQAQHDWTYEWQGSATCAYFDNEEACAFSVGKRTGRFLWNGVVGYVPAVRKHGVAFTGNWRF